MLGKAGLWVIMKGTRSDVSFEACFCSFKASFRGICFALEIWSCSSAERCSKNPSVEQMRHKRKARL